MRSLLRTATLARRAATSMAGPSTAFSTSTTRFIADNKNDSSPARDHRPRSAVGPSGPGQISAAKHSKDENLGVQSSAEEGVTGGKTQRDAINSAMGVWDNLARDVASNPSSSSVSSSSIPSEVKTSAVVVEGVESTPISTPSSPTLTAVHQTAGPLYTPSTLPPGSDPTLSFLTNLLMKDGKKAQAQRFTTRTLSIIANITNSNPLALIHDAISRTAPLVKMQSKKQGGKSLQVPVALTKRQSERKALTWIIEASKKRPDRELERRLAAEFLAVSEGTSAAIGRKEEQHKIATVNRANAAVRI